MLSTVNISEDCKYGYHNIIIVSKGTVLQVCSTSTALSCFLTLKFAYLHM